MSEPAKTVNFGPGGSVALGDYEVYTRDAWRLDLPWQPAPNLVAVETTWSMAPALPVCALEWRFGTIRQPKDPTAAGAVEGAPPGALARWRRGQAERVHRLQDLHGRLVKIRFADGRKWVGVLEVENEHQAGTHTLSAAEGGDGEPTATGMQRLVAYGLERLLDVPIDRSVYETGDDPDTAETRALLEFNADGAGNRSTTTADSGAYVFAAAAGSTAPFANWSTRKIVGYLLKYFQPKDVTGGLVLGPAAGLVLSSGGSDALPDWDRPTVSTAGKTLYSLLVELIDRRRLLGFYVRYTEGADATAADDSVELHCVTYTAAAIDPEVPGGEPLPANPATRALIFDSDQLTTASFKASDVGTVDQVVVEGEERRCVGTLSYTAADDSTPGSWADGWTADELADYTLGPEDADDWADAGTAQRQKIAAHHRGSFETVLSHFVLPESWDLNVADRSDFDGTAVDRDVFPDAFAFPLHEAALELEATLPLLAGVDYSGDKIKAGTYTVGDHKIESPPAAWLRRVDDDQPAGAIAGDEPYRYVAADAVGLAAGVEAGVDEDNALSCDVRTKGRAVIVKVKNGPQHFLDGANFTHLDVDEKSPAYDRFEMLFTVSLTGNRTRVAWPPDESIHKTAGQPIPRRSIDAPGVGETYVVPGTVVGITADGRLKYSTTGGFIPARDEELGLHAQLLAIAKLAAAYYTQRRLIATIRSRRFFGSGDLELGNLVLRCGADDSPAKREGLGPITQIKYHSPLAELDQPAHWETEITTHHGELDALRLVPATPGHADPRAVLAARPLAPPRDFRLEAPAGEFRQ